MGGILDASGSFAEAEGAGRRAGAKRLRISGAFLESWPALFPPDDAPGVLVAIIAALLLAAVYGFFGVGLVPFPGGAILRVKSLTSSRACEGGQVRTKRGSAMMHFLSRWGFIHVRSSSGFRREVGIKVRRAWMKQLRHARGGRMPVNAAWSA